MLTVIDQTLRARLCVPAAEDRVITATLLYQCDDPLAARMSFPASATLDGSDVTWTFARDLLAAGLRLPSGEGDVHVWPCGPRRIMIELSSPDGVALLQLDSGDVRDFLTRSYAAVPPGDEHRHVDFEAVFAALLADE
ncbi:SsgA family sporulation/cell division regulator [Streptomyces sp. H10-C2]|uniref:SsgA family sporulation/cell division regulator n=1 Tax=unclassified Streptomyces TaxID=2593676 RepID=UPI0024B989EA|nr:MULTISPECIES: SsgA family sporulation/cell division regulator [unclassified Streptomyces]MDJ0342307.1 SsgA family sporulation/cell division regulator [Streptomyces sp. PH10-H1]MDJ0372162.1 SsgA family sporulation/cell division regulator [Streptomyces sp. H10-C2]